MRKWKLARLWTLLVCMALTLTLALAVTACGKQPTTSEPGAAVSAPAGPAKNLDAAEVRATKTLRLTPPHLHPDVVGYFKRHNENAVLSIMDMT